jgi:hypothetical protein
VTRGTDRRIMETKERPWRHQPEAAPVRWWGSEPTRNGFHSRVSSTWVLRYIPCCCLRLVPPEHPHATQPVLLHCLIRLQSAVTCMYWFIDSQVILRRCICCIDDASSNEIGRCAWLVRILEEAVVVCCRIRL